MNTMVYVNLWFIETPGRKATTTKLSQTPVCPLENDDKTKHIQVQNQTNTSRRQS